MKTILALPLVYCGTGGIMPKGMAEKQAKPGELIVLAGGFNWQGWD